MKTFTTDRGPPTLAMSIASSKYFVRRSYTNYNKSTDSHPVAAAVAIFILVLDKTAQCPGATEVSRATKTRFAGIEGVRQRGQHSNSLEVSGKRIYRSAC